MQAVAKDLELYKGDDPPSDWTLDTEVEGVLKEADARGMRVLTGHCVDSDSAAPQRPARTPE